MTKTYRAVLEITDDCIPQPLNRQEIKSLIEEEPSRIFGGVKVTCIELTEMEEKGK